MDACEALLVVWKEDDGLPCYPLMEQYSTDVLGTGPAPLHSVTLCGNWRTTEVTSYLSCYTVHVATAEGNCFSRTLFWRLPGTRSSLHATATASSGFSKHFSFRKQ